MMRRRSRDRATFLPTLASNLAVLAGIAVLGWRAQNVLFVYWVEIGSFVVIYSGLTLFAEREPSPEGRTVSPVTLPVPFLSSRSGSARPVEWLPPVYYRNVRYAAGLLVWGLGFWLCLSLLMVVLPSPEPLAAPGEASVRLGDYVSIVAAPVSPGTLASVFALIVSKLVNVRRGFLDQRRYERLSAPMTAEIPARQVVFWFLLIPVAQFVVPLLTLPLVDVVGTRTLTQVGVASVVVLGKLTVEWSAFRARQCGESDGVAGWFTPEEYKPG